MKSDLISWIGEEVTKKKKKWRHSAITAMLLAAARSDLLFRKKRRLNLSQFNGLFPVRQNKSFSYHVVLTIFFIITSCNHMRPIYEKMLSGSTMIL